jgi:hypothetical protein
LLPALRMGDLGNGIQIHGYSYDFKAMMLAHTYVARPTPSS